MVFSAESSAEGLKGSRGRGEGEVDKKFNPFLMWQVTYPSSWDVCFDTIRDFWFLVVSTSLEYLTEYVWLRTYDNNKSYTKQIYFHWVKQLARHANMHKCSYIAYLHPLTSNFCTTIMWASPLIRQFIIVPGNGGNEAHMQCTGFQLNEVSSKCRAHSHTTSWVWSLEWWFGAQCPEPFSLWAWVRCSGWKFVPPFSSSFSPVYVNKLY